MYEAASEVCVSDIGLSFREGREGTLHKGRQIQGRARERRQMNKHGGVLYEISEAFST